MTLPALIDCKGIQNEMHVKRAAAEAIMRPLPKIKLDGCAAALNDEALAAKNTPGVNPVVTEPTERGAKPHES